LKLLKKAAIAVLLSIMLAQSTLGYVVRPIEPVSPSLFVPVPVPSYEPPLAPIYEPAPSIARATGRPDIAAPRAEAKVIQKVTNGTVSLTGNSLAGTASYYCNADASRGPLSRCHKDYPDGQDSYYAAISKHYHDALRGKVVSVCVGSKCLPVKIMDCNCGPNPNLIDLYGDAFAYFYPLTKGKFTVTVKW
jgi:hypothetical protein